MALKQVLAIDRFFQALGDPTRLRLLNLMDGGELCVCYLVTVLREPQPKISRHLAALRSAGLVLARRDGKWMHYRLAVPEHPGAAAVLRKTLKWLRDDIAMQADRARLERACRAPARFVELLGAPLPLSAAKHLPAGKHQGRATRDPERTAAR